MTLNIRHGNGAAIPGITVPNIRAVLCVQNKVLADRNKIRSGRLVEELLKEAGGMEVRP